MSVSTDINVSGILVIDTDKYAGNFEREMCGYVTGGVGECGVGQDTAEIFRKEVGEQEEECTLGDYLSHPADDNGCHRPCSIWASPGKISEYNSVAIFFNEKPPKNFIDLMKERILKFPEYANGDSVPLYKREKIEILRIYWIDRTVTIRDETMEL